MGAVAGLVGEMTTVYTAIEFNWNRLGGIFSTRRLANDWCKRQETVEPNLMWEIHTFTIDKPLSDKEAAQDWTGL